MYTKLDISFNLNSTLFEVTGAIRWKKTLSTYTIKGIQLENDDFTQKRIINELKLYVKRDEKTGYRH